MIIVKALLISSILFYIYAFCSVRLITQEFKPYIQFLQSFKSPWAFYGGTAALVVLSPLIFVIVLVTKILWKVTNFLLK